MVLPALMLAAAVTVAPQTASPQTALPQTAERITYTSAYDVWALTDGSYATRVSVPESGIEITADKPVYGAYIVWNDLTACTIDHDGEWEEIPADYLHQFVELDGATSFRISPYEETRLCELYLYTDGELPREVQRWEPVLSRCDILAMPTHADDEVLMFGGTLPYYAGELGLDVQVVYMTNHLAEPPRPHELLDSIWACGVTAYPIISEFPDLACWTLEQAFWSFDEDAVTEFQVETIRRVKPSVIVAHDINGEYGHGAHMLNCYTMMEALEHTANPEDYPESAEKYGVWDVPKTYIHFWKENQIQMDWERPLQSFGGITAREAAEYAYSFHKSQHVWGYSVNYKPLWDCRQFGLYRTLVGTDTTADFMEHITPVAMETNETGETGETNDTSVTNDTNDTSDTSDTNATSDTDETLTTSETNEQTQSTADETVSAFTTARSESVTSAEGTDPTESSGTSAEAPELQSAAKAAPPDDNENSGNSGIIFAAITALAAVVCFTAAIIIKKVRK